MDAKETIQDVVFAHGHIYFAARKQDDEGVIALLGKMDLNGNFDLSFNGTGMLEINANTYNAFSGLRVFGGSILAVGSSGTGETNEDYKMWRFFMDGNPDLGFGTQGVVQLDFSDPETFHAVALLGEDTLVFGQSDDTPANHKMGTIHKFQGPYGFFLDFRNWPQSNLLSYAAELNAM